MEFLRINGTKQHFPDERFPPTLAQLLAHLNIEAATVVAEVDGAVIERENFAETELNPGQSVELIRFVGGG